MKCLILAAGRGERLRPLTDKVCKPMTDICGKPCLERIVDHLAAFGITEIVVNVHWLKEQIMDYFGNRLLYYYEPELLGAEETEKRLQPWLGDKYLVCNGDTLTDVSISDLETATMLFKTTSQGFDRTQDVYMGTKIVIPNTGPGKWYVEDDCYWQDIGTFPGLEAARKHYEESGVLPKV